MSAAAKLHRQRPLLGVTVDGLSHRSALRASLEPSSDVRQLQILSG